MPQVIGTSVIYYPDAGAVISGRGLPAIVHYPDPDDDTQATIRVFAYAKEDDYSPGPNPGSAFSYSPDPITIGASPVAGQAVDPALLARNWASAVLDVTGGPVTLVDIAPGESRAVPYTFEGGSALFSSPSPGILEISDLVHGLFGIGGAISFESSSVIADITADIVVGRNLGQPGEVSSVVFPFAVGASPTGNPRGLPTISTARLGAVGPAIGPNQIAVRLSHNQDVNVTITLYAAVLIVNQFAALSF